MRRNDERDDKTDFQRNDKARGLHTRNMEKDTYKSERQKKGMWKMSETTTRFAHCQRCTKLFSTLIYNRLYDRLHRAQLEDEGGFRRSYQTLDHLATYRLLEQKCQEWCIKMWVATVDFMKAFDSISHKSPWKALDKGGIEPQYISLLRRLYAEQKGTVFTDRESDLFETGR